VIWRNARHAHFFLNSPQIWMLRVANIVLDFCWEQKEMPAIKFRLGALALATLGTAMLLATGSLNAAPVTYNFATGGVNSNPGVSGNTVTFMDSTSTYSVGLTSWTDIVVPGSLTQATGFVTGAPNVQGFGVCDSTEGTFAACTGGGGNSPVRGLDNANGQNWVLLVFSQAVNLSAFTIFPDVGNTPKDQDLDVTYFTGNISGASAVQNRNYAYLTGTLGMTQYNVDFAKGQTGVTVDVTAQNGNTEVWGNAILIGGSRTSGADRFFLSGMTTVVPVPAAVWLFASALAVLLGRRRFT
jgi:hypothetical protein